MSVSFDSQKFDGSYIELIIPRRRRAIGDTDDSNSEGTPIRSVSQYCERLFGSQFEDQYTFIKKIAVIRAVPDEIRTLSSYHTSIYPVEKICKDCRKIEFFMSIIEDGNKTLVVGDLKCKKCGKWRRIGEQRCKSYSQVRRSRKARQSEVFFHSSVTLLAKENKDDAADFEEASFVSEYMDSNFLENLYKESSRRLNLDALHDDSVSTVSSRLSESTFVTVAAQSRPQVDASLRSAVNYLEGSCSQFDSLSGENTAKTEEMEEEHLLGVKVRVEDIPTFTRMEKTRDRQSTVDEYEDIERSSTIFAAENNIYEFVVDTESEDESDVEIVYEDDVALKRVDEKTGQAAMKKLRFQEENLHSFEEDQKSPPVTSVYYPKPNITYEYLQDAAIEGRLSKMLQYKKFLRNRYPKLSHSVYCSESRVPVHRYDADVCCEDPFDYKLTELKQTRNKPINFIIIAKPGIDTYNLAAELSLMWGNVLITPLTVLRDPNPYKSYVSYHISQTLRLGNRAPMSEVFALIEQRILQDEEVRHLGYTLAGLPFAPRHEDNLSISEQLLRIFNWPNKPDALVYLMCPTPDVLSMANNMQFSMKTGSIVHEGMVTHGEKLSKKQPVEVQRELNTIVKDLYEQEKGGTDSGPQFRIHLPLSDVRQLSKDIKLFSEPVLFVLDSYVLQMDPQMVIKVDARTPVNRMIQIVKKKLDTMLVQKLDRVVPLFDASLVLEYEKKKQLEEEAKKEAASRKLSKKRVKIFVESEENETVTEEEEEEEEEEEIEDEEKEYAETDEEGETTDKISKIVNFDKLNALPDDKLLLLLQTTNTLAPEIRWTETMWGCNCPVSVYDGLLRRGRAEYTVTYLGKVYMLSSRDAFDRFTRSPMKFCFPSLPISNRIFLYGNEYIVDMVKDKFGMQVIDFDVLKSLAVQLKKLSGLSKYLQEWRKFKMLQFKLVEQNKFNITEEVRAQMIADWRDKMIALVMDYLVYKDWLSQDGALKSYGSKSSSFSYDSFDSIDWAIKLNLPDIYYQEYATKDTLSSFTLAEISLPSLAIDDDVSLDSVQQQVIDFVTKYTEEQEAAKRRDEVDTTTLCEEGIILPGSVSFEKTRASGQSLDELYRTSAPVRSGERLPPIQNVKFKVSSSEIVSIAQGSVILRDTSKSSHKSSEDKLPPLASGKTFEALEVSASAQDTRLRSVSRRASSERFIEGRQRGSKSSVTLSPTAGINVANDIDVTDRSEPSIKQSYSSYSEPCVADDSEALLQQVLKQFNLVEVQSHYLEKILKKILRYVVSHTVPHRKSSAKQIADNRRIIKNICNEFFTNMMTIINEHRLVDKRKSLGEPEITVVSQDVPLKRKRRDAIDVDPSFFDDLLLHLLKTTKKAIKQHPLFRKTQIFSESDTMESRTRVFGNTSDEDVETVKARVKHAKLNPEFCSYFLDLLKEKTLKTTSSTSIKEKDESIDVQIQFLKEMEILKLATSKIFYGDDLMLLKDRLVEKTKISSSEEYILNRFKHRIIRIMPRSYSTIAEETEKFGPLEKRLQLSGLPVCDDVNACLAIVEDPEKVLKYLPQVYSHFWYSPDIIREDHPIVEKALKAEANRYLNTYKELDTVTDLEAVELLITIMQDIKNTKIKDKQRNGCVVVNVPRSEELWECLSGNSLLPTDVLFVQGEIPPYENQEEGYLENENKPVTDVIYDNPDQDEAETESEKLVDPSVFMTKEDSDDVIGESQLVESVNIDDETPGSDVLRKSVSNVPAAKTLPSLMDLIRSEEVPPASDHKARFGFEDAELDNFIYEICSARDSNCSSKSTLKGDTVHLSRTKLYSSEFQRKLEVDAANKETRTKRQMGLTDLVQLCNMKGEYQDETENQEDSEPSPIADLEIETEEKVDDVEEEVIPDSWINFKNTILAKYGLDVSNMNYEIDKLPLFEQKISNLIDAKFKPKARRFMKADKEILLVSEKVEKKKDFGEGEEDEAEEVDDEEEKTEEVELENEEEDEEGGEEAAEEEEEEEAEEGEYKTKKVPPEVNERLEINRNYGDTFPYCPVLFKKGVYREGVKKIATVYLNQIHLFSSRDALNEFLQKPEAYAYFSSPPEIPPPRICIVGALGCNASLLCKSLAQLLGIYYVSLYGEINFHIMPTDSLPIGLLYESPRCVKEVPVTVKPVQATEAEIDSVNRIRRYLNYCSPLPDYLLERYMIDPIWRQQPYASQGFCYYRFPHTAGDMRRMVQMHCLPDVIIHVQSNLKNVKNLIKKVTKKWKISQGIVKKMLIERDKIEKRTFWRNHKAMFRKLLLDFLENESQRLSAQASGSVIKEETSERLKILSAEDTTRQSLERTTESVKESELLPDKVEGGKINSEVSDGKDGEEIKLESEETDGDVKDKIAEEMKTYEKLISDGYGKDDDDGRVDDISVTNRENDMDTLVDDQKPDEEEKKDSATSNRVVKDIIKAVIDDILRQPSWIFSHRFYDYLEKTGLRPRPGFNPKRHNKTQRRIILRNILQIHEIETKLFPKIGRIIRENQSRLKLIANKIRYFDKVPDPNIYLTAAFHKESQQITQIKKLAKDNQIPWITCSAKDKVDKLYFYVSDVIRERITYLLKTDLLTVETAEKLLKSGHLALSKFGRWCPVQLAEGTNPVQMYFLAEKSADEIFPVVFRKYVYFLSSKEAKTKFCLNPMKYVQGDAYARVIPLKCAVIGPPKAGKTEFANRLAREFGVEVVSNGSALRYVTEEMPWTDLAKTLLSYLKSGRLVPDALSIRAVEAALISPKSTTQGWVLDGCPDNVAQLMKLYEFNIVPTKIILLDRTFSECLYNSQTIYYPQTSLRRKPVYSAKLLEQKYRIWMTDGERRRLLESIRELWGNLHIHSGNKTSYFVYQTAKPYLLQALTVHRKYMDRIMKETTADLKEMCITSLEFAEHQHPDFRSYCPVCWIKHALTRFPNKIPFSIVRTCLIQYKSYFYWVCPCHYSLFLKSPDRYLYAGGPKLKRVFERLYLHPMMAQACESYRAGGHCIVCYCHGWPKQVLKKGYTNYILGHQNTVYAFCSEDCMDEFLLRSEFYSSIQVKNEDNVVKYFTPLSPEMLSLHPLGFLHQYVADAVYSVLKELVKEIPYYPGLSAKQSALIYIGYHLKCESLSDPVERECYEKGYSQYKERIKTLKHLIRAITHAKNPFHPDANLSDENQIAEFKKQIVESMTVGRTESVYCKIHGQKLYTAEQLPAVVDKYSSINDRNKKQVTHAVDKCLKSLFTYFNNSF